MEDADWKLIEAVQDDLLDPGVVMAAVREAADTLTATPETVGVRSGLSSPVAYAPGTARLSH